MPTALTSGAHPWKNRANIRLQSVQEQAQPAQHSPPDGCRNRGRHALRLAAPALAYLEIATERLYPVAVCMQQPISTMPLAGASPSPVGNAMRSSAPPWARSALYSQRSQDAMMTQTLYAGHDVQSITHTPQCSPHRLVGESRALSQKRSVFSPTTIADRK